MIAFTVNGAPVTVDRPGATRLADALRDDLGLTGTKIGCNAGDCGACTVLLDGRQVCACLVALGQAEGRQVVTIEGLAADSRAAALREAFRRHGAAQCGICTPAMLVAAADLLARTNGVALNEAAVADALGGVLCRCTGYRKIIDAVLDAAGGAAPEVAPCSGPAIGARLARVDAAAKITGAEIFGADRVPAGALWLRAVRSPHARARFTLGDFSELLARHAGLVRVLTSADVPGNNGFGIYPTIKDQPVLAEGEVRYRGEAVVALVGSRETVENLPDAAVPIDWQVLAPVTEMAAALDRAAPQLHGDRPGNVLAEGRVEAGNVAAALATAPAVATASYETGFVEHAYIEPEAGHAVRRGERIEIHGCTQTPYMDRAEVAQVLGIVPERVRIVPSACGGGFGGKLDLSFQPLVAVAAWLLDRPVAMVYSRPESLAASTKRHPAKITATFAADQDGRLVAARFHGDFNTGAYASWGPTVADRVPVHASGPYTVPNYRATSRAVLTNAPPSGAFRGFGVPQAALAHEGLLDELADQLGLDPLEIRLTNALRVGDATVTGQRLKASAGLVACLEALRPRWRELRQAAEAANVNGKGTRRGVGIGCMWYGIGNTSLSNPSTMRVALAADGRLTLYNGAQEIGQGSATIMVQICADALGLGFDRFDQVMGDTDLTADAGKTSASRQAFVSGKAAELAGADLRARILRLANAGPGARLRLNGAALTVEDGAATRTIALDELPAEANGAVLSGEGTFDPPTTPLDENGQGDPYATYGFAAQIAEVEVDLALGRVVPKRIIAAHDVGRAINPTLVEGQIHGGIAQGLGLALMEDYRPGVTENLHDYLIPTIGDVPPIECHLIEDPEPLGPSGAKGIGEPALVSTAPAILGAIRHATGVAIRHLPATPDRVRAALKAAGKV